MAKERRSIGIGLLGLGTVGSGVVKILRSEAKAIEQKTGVRLELKRVAVRSLSRKRPVRVPRSILTTRPMAVVNDPSVDIVVEVMGGIQPAKTLVEKALAQGKQVVTANKALLAENGEAIFKLAAKHAGQIGMEASVCGGIPIIEAMREGFASNNIQRFLGIVNGTCNYILTEMSLRGADFNSALKAAQKKGFAEADPSLDIDGVDSAHKLAVLARLAFHSEIPFRSIPVEGIRHLCAADIAYASELGYVIKLLAIGKRRDGGLELRVHPTLLPLDHPLATVRGSYNAVYVHADQAGDQLFYGKGAGMMPTASAVMSDIIDIAQKIVTQAVVRTADTRPLEKLRVLPPESLASKYYLRFQVADKPGVLGAIAKTLGQNHISILSVHQKETHSTRSVPVVILTYEASEKNVRKALGIIDRRGDVREKTTVIRVEN